MSAPAAVYRPRNPQFSDYYRCVEDHFETFVQVYEEQFERQYGFYRPYLQKVIYRYLDCGDLHNGFARVKCKDCGNRISPNDETAVENPARCIIRASFSQERMTYLDHEATVDDTAKDGKDAKVFDAPVSSTGQALEWLATMCSHIPNRGEQPVILRYYGWYSNVSRGKRQMAGSDDAVPCILEPQGDERTFRKSWARLIQKIGACPREGGEGRSPNLPEACPRGGGDVRGSCGSSASSKMRRSLKRSSNTWESGSSGQGRRRKYMTRRLPNTS